MRRGTPAAEQFGELLALIRGDKSMRQVAEIIGTHASTVSQVEKAERALKKHNIYKWAKGLDVSEWDLMDLWWLCQSYTPADPVGSYVFNDDKEAVRYRIIDVMTDINPLLKFQIDLSKIEPDKPATRNRGKTVEKKTLEARIEKLTAPQRERVLGYIDALIEGD